MAMMFKICVGKSIRDIVLCFSFAIFLCLICSSCFYLTQFFQDLSFCFAYDVDSIVVIGSIALKVMIIVIFILISSSLVPILPPWRLDDEKNVFYFYYMLNCLFLFIFFYILIPFWISPRLVKHVTYCVEFLYIVSHLILVPTIL